MYTTEFDLFPRMHILLKLNRIERLCVLKDKRYVITKIFRVIRRANNPSLLVSSIDRAAY